MANAELACEYSETAVRTELSSTPPPLIDERLFRGALVRERKRADRSNQPLALVLLTPDLAAEPRPSRVWWGIAEAVCSAKRETDVVGWFDNRDAIGLLMPEISSPGPNFRHDIHERVRRELARQLDTQSLNRVSIRMHIHPDPETIDGANEADPIAGQALQNTSRLNYAIAKRALDIVLSAALLTMLSPLFLVLAAMVKLTSRGPVFFRQERVGQMMKPFKMLKFRTMRVNNDHAIHHQFVSSFIKSGGKTADAGENTLFKIANDPRVTTAGRILRRTSLDELPQLWNVLRGDMSLVGPRPPLAYEVEQYQSWHRRRVLEAKPGLTGLWQVTGRSRTTFDEMVRLDLRYARTHSVWTDIKILLATPRAVISGKGAC